MPVRNKQRFCAKKCRERCGPRIAPPAKCDENATDDHCTSASHHIGEISAWHLYKYHHRGKHGLKNHHIGQSKTAILEEHHDNGDRNHEGLHDLDGTQEIDVPTQ